jgi:hypothetical protein
VRFSDKLRNRILTWLHGERAPSVTCPHCKRIYVQLPIPCTVEQATVQCICGNPFDVHPKRDYATSKRGS